MITHDETRTARRESREGYIRFLFSRIMDKKEVDNFFTTVHLDSQNIPLSQMVYTGNYDRAVELAEKYVDLAATSSSDSDEFDLDSLEPAVTIGG